MTQNALSFKLGSNYLHRKLMNLAVFSGILALQRSTCVSKLGNLQICCKLCILVGKQWTLRHLTFWRRTPTLDDFLLKIIWPPWPPCPVELKVKTLEGADLSVKVMPTSTIQELKAMLHEKKGL